jgi:hypothetical protein
MDVSRPFVHIQMAQSKSKFDLPSFSQPVQSVFGEFNTLVIVSQMMTLQDPAGVDLYCIVARVLGRYDHGSALVVMFLGSSIKQSTCIPVNSIDRRNLIFPKLVVQSTSKSVSGLKINDVLFESYPCVH